MIKEESTFPQLSCENHQRYEAQKIPLDLIEELMKLSSQLMCLILRDNDKFKELYDGQ